MFLSIKIFLRSASFFFFLLWGITCSYGQQLPKREFRGVWIATVANIDWPSGPNLSSEVQRDEFRSLLNRHQKNGINAVIVQVRPSADALYRSSREPWSEWLTGMQGQAPDPEYDPLTFMIEEAHERGMEFHAWLNPYRAIFDVEKFYRDTAHVHLDTLKNVIQNLNEQGGHAEGLSAEEHTDLLQLLKADTSMMLYRHPELFLQYGNKIYFDPGMPEGQAHIAEVVRDIVSRYEIDAVHMDDYFYPYRIAGLEFPDSLSFKKFGTAYTAGEKDDWRRENVNAIVKTLNETIKSVNPRVKFGISPFGVWRNASTDPSGSNTKAGQTNYDDLFADVLKWQKEKWIDYVIPQIYWHRGFDLADYETLANWWNDNANGVQVYIGMGFYRIDAESKTEAWRNPMEIPEQAALNRSLPNIQGSCFYSSKPMLQNPLGVADFLREYYFYEPALVPEMNHLGEAKPLKPTILGAVNGDRGITLEWTGPAKYYVVYRFKGSKIGDLNDPANIVSILGKSYTFLEDRSVRRFRKYTYVVTALNASFGESPASVPLTVKWKKPKLP